jgi:hypothetical protein
MSEKEEPRLQYRCASCDRLCHIYMAGIMGNTRSLCCNGKAVLEP